jgi:hypothetical protein
MSTYITEEHRLIYWKRVTVGGGGGEIKAKKIGRNIRHPRHKISKFLPKITVTNERDDTDATSRTEKMRNAHSITAEKHKGRISYGRTGLMWGDNTKIDLN